MAVRYIIILILTALLPFSLLSTDIKTKSGKKYTDIKIFSVGENGVRIINNADKLELIAFKDLYAKYRKKIEKKIEKLSKSTKYRTGTIQFRIPSIYKKCSKCNGRGFNRKKEKKKMQFSKIKCEICKGKGSILDVPERTENAKYFIKTGKFKELLPDHIKKTYEKAEVKRIENIRTAVVKINDYECLKHELKYKNDKYASTFKPRFLKAQEAKMYKPGNIREENCKKYINDAYVKLSKCIRDDSHLQTAMAEFEKYKAKERQKKEKEEQLKKAQEEQLKKEQKKKIAKTAGKQKKAEPPKTTSKPAKAEPSSKTTKKSVKTESPSKTVSKPAKPQSSKWHEGGTLHKATMKEWRAASYQNRLATSSDFLIKLIKVDGKTVPPIEDLKPYAVEFEKGISKAGKGGVKDNQNVSETAAATWILMKAKN